MLFDEATTAVDEELFATAGADPLEVELVLGVVLEAAFFSTDSFLSMFVRLKFN